MKLFDLAMVLDKPDIKVIIIDSKTRRIRFNGNADELLDYSSIDFLKVTRIKPIDNGLKIEVKV